jgi:hypothetical protein
LFTNKLAPVKKGAPAAEQYLPAPGQKRQGASCFQFIAIESLLQYKKINFFAFGLF